MNFVLFSFSVPMLNATFKFNCTKLHQQCQTLVTICHIKSHHHFQTDRKSMLSQLTSVGSLRLTPLDLLPLWCVGKGGTKWRKYMNTCMFPHSAYPVFSYCSTVQSCKLCRVSLFCGKPLLPHTSSYSRRDRERDSRSRAPRGAELARAWGGARMGLIIIL